MKDKKRHKYIFLLCLTALFFAGPAHGENSSGGYNPGAGIAEGYSEAGTRAAEFLSLPVGGRGVAMGGAFGVALSG